MATPDYATWLTKQQAADTIGVSTKTVEQLARDQQLQQGLWRPQGRGPLRAVYHPDDVARIAQERRPGAAPFVLAADGNGNGHGTRTIRNPEHEHSTGGGALVPLAGTSDDVLRAVFAAALRAVTSQSSQKSDALFLTLAEASTYSGLSETHLRKCIAAGTLAAVKDRGWKVRRKDLEAL